ncbi:2Fe-2S iron-sulfur cluster binding domain-containing protein [Spirosoma sp. HMF4905]|uniref:2Fe-2S iron-sulfur cluster binding domain-containing protein n=1 Tax=Spirosoma arboris TaxID=2682092 RepID=A0A7K1S7F0_9BACT|nr:ferredoxin--NADP reductase [Spirosoma arboris]MVM29761.1 2Fe-2S iron-sulfur cluster binding domain-containing protein [Spirosoma arboris]
MTDDFLQLRIVRIVPETGDSNSYFLEPLNGQFIPYHAGQFLTLIILHNGHEVRRSYSLSSTPEEKALRLTIKRVQNGEISRYLHDTLRIGDVVTSLYPAGRFTLDEDQAGDVVLFGAGSGITPLFGLIKQMLGEESAQRVTLFYSSPNERNIIFRDELNDLQDQFPERFRLIYLLSNPSDDWSGLRGRLNNVMLERLLPELIGASNPEEVRFYVCGPGDYMRMIQFTLVFSGFRSEQIRRENFVVEPVFLTPPPLSAQDRTVLLRFRGHEVEIQVPAYKSILQAALDEGIHLPYSCRGGRCSTCAARCLSGSVHMTINDVLTERDLSQGWVLTCTGFPESDGVVIDVV